VNILKCVRGYQLRQAPQLLIDAVIRVYDAAGKLIEVHRHKGDFKEP